MPAKALLNVTCETGTQSFELDPGTYLLGRDPDCDLVVDSIFIPRQQARLTVARGFFQVEQLPAPPPGPDGEPAPDTKSSYKYPGEVHVGSVSLNLRLQA